MLAGRYAVTQRAQVSGRRRRRWSPDMAVALVALVSGGCGSSDAARPTPDQLASRFESDAHVSRPQSMCVAERVSGAYDDAVLAMLYESGPSALSAAQQTPYVQAMIGCVLGSDSS